MAVVGGVRGGSSMTSAALSSTSGEGVGDDVEAKNEVASWGNKSSSTPVRSVTGGACTTSITRSSTSGEVFDVGVAAENEVLSSMDKSRSTPKRTSAVKLTVRLVLGIRATVGGR
jgi:hypothetical protein